MRYCCPTCGAAWVPVVATDKCPSCGAGLSQEMRDRVNGLIADEYEETLDGLGDPAPAKKRVSDRLAPIGEAPLVVRLDAAHREELERLVGEGRGKDLGDALRWLVEQSTNRRGPRLRT